jgi:acetyltransferase-like isoleucine patch superfamily enzyme
MSKVSAAQAVGLGISYFRTFAGLLWRMEAKAKGAIFEGSARLEGRPIITLARGSRMILGNQLSLNNATRANPVGCFQPCVLRTLSAGAELIIAKNVGLSATVICAGASIWIGAHTIAGSGAMILDNDFHELDGTGKWRDEYSKNARSIRIGERVFIGARAIILKGVTIGDEAVIGAGAVVTRDVPAQHIAAGNPAQVFPKKTAVH